MQAALAAPRNLSHLLRLGAIGMASLLTITLLTVSWQLADRFDAAARANARHQVTMGVASLRSRNEVVVRDYAFWTDAWEGVARADLDWLDLNIGAGAEVTGTMDAIVLTGGGLPGVLGWAGPELEGLARAAYPSMARIAEDLVQTLDHRPGDPSVSTFARINGRLWLLSVHWVVPQGLERIDGPLALMISALKFDARIAGELGEMFLVDGLEVLSEAPAGPDHVALLGSDGPLAWLAWPPPRPGLAALQGFAVPLAAVLTLTGVGVGFAMVAASRLAGRLERALVTSQAADRTKAEFIATLSHELRTPMNGIVGMLDLLASTELAPDQAEFVKVAFDSAEAQLALIDRLLRFGQIEAGQAVLSVAPFSPQALLAEVAALARPSAEARGLALRMSEHGPTDTQLLGDRMAIRQIVLNLVGNAVKFTEQGEVVLRLTVAPGLGVHRLRMAVSDTGPGVAPADRARIFDSFAQGDSAPDRRHAGVGLGLAISRRLAEAMGGTLTLAAAGPPGATFVFEVALDTVRTETELLGEAA